jgi:hypothetical protein
MRLNKLELTEIRKDLSLFVRNRKIKGKLLFD